MQILLEASSFPSVDQVHYSLIERVPEQCQLDPNVQLAILVIASIPAKVVLVFLII